jgi:hypothetical protein
MDTRSRRSAYTLTDLAALVTVTAILGAVAIAALSDTRRNARLGEDLASLQRFAAATTAYAADNEDLIWALSWQDGGEYQMLQLDGTYEPFMPTSDEHGARYQMVHLIRLIGNRIGNNGMPNIGGLLAAGVYYSHLPLMQYLGQDPLARWTVSAADNVRLNWKDDPQDKFDNGFWLPFQPSPSPTARRWPYSCGFEVTVSAWDVNQSELGPEFNGFRVEQSTAHNLFLIGPDDQLGQRPMSDVAYPGAKAHMFLGHQRHFGPTRTYFGVTHDVDGTNPKGARVPVLTFDGAVLVRSLDECNPGWRPNIPYFSCHLFYYQPSSWEPAPVSGGGSEIAIGKCRWTRGGLLGIDFGALPLDTGQPDPGECDL